MVSATVGRTRHPYYLEGEIYYGLKDEDNLWRACYLWYEHAFMEDRNNALFTLLGYYAEYVPAAAAQAVERIRWELPLDDQQTLVLALLCGDSPVIAELKGRGVGYDNYEQYLMACLVGGLADRLEDSLAAACIERAKQEFGITGASANYLYTVLQQHKVP